MPGPSLRRLTLVASLALPLAGCGQGGSKAGGAPGDTTSEPTAVVRLGTLETRTFADEITVAGQWKSGGDVVIAAPFDGVVESVTYRPGDRVAGGATLAVLVTRESDAALRGAELMVREARDPAARAEAEAARALARRERVRVPVHAPRAGVVSHRAAEPGAQIALSAEIVTLVPESAIVFEARVPPRDAPRLRRGLRALVIEDGQPARATRLDRILPAAGTGDQTTLCWLVRERGGAPPALDRYASARLTLGAPHPAVGVPDSGVVEDDLTGTKRIAVVGSDSHLTWNVVTLGDPEQGWRELLRPRLPAGTRVVIEGQRGLPDRTRVRVGP